MIASGPKVDEAVVWHDVECGGYGADLPVWEELAAMAARGPEAGASVLELGCGTGRVALHLAARGHRVCGVDVDEALLTALAERAGAGGLAVEARRADVRDLRLGRRFDVVVAPMQLAQLLDEVGRGAMLAAVARHLAPRGLAAFALMDEVPEEWRAGSGAEAPSPDVREVEGWVYSSLPIAIEPREDGVAVHRLRQVVSPAGELRESEDLVWLHDLPAGRLEREAQAAGLIPRERREVAATADHLGSTIVICEAGR